MFRSLLVISAATFIATPATAATYSAKPATPISERFVARDITWACGPDACQGSTLESRPVVLCQSLAKRAGHIDSFLVDGRAFGADELAKCNSAAKATPAAAVAAH